MKNNDDTLIQDVLDGDDTAFETLVKKHHKSVHALVWRKIGDFHIAEEITQDTFLKAYQRLSTLKEPQSFLSWLYVIATNRCKAWHRKKRLWTQPLDKASNSELEKAAYSNYVIEQNKRDLAETQQQVVKKLLAKLPESDRTVITLYYLAEMTYEEISNFLGVSEAAIRNRLYRARRRLKKEETMIREALDHFQISPNLTDNVMQEISRIKPTAPSGSKPFVPWIIGATSAILIVFILGIGSQYLAHFQKPYSLDTQAETTVELVDTPVVLNIDAKPDVQNRLGNPNIVGPSDNNGQKPDGVLLAAAQADGEDVSVPKQQWIQSEPIKGSYANSLHVTPEGELYANDGSSIYKLPADGKGWQHISDLTPLRRWGGYAPIKKWRNTLYIMISNEFYASIDDGKTWDLVYSWPKEYMDINDNNVGELVLTDQAFYVAFDKGIFRSEDTGKTWEAINQEFMGNIHSLVNIQNLLFAKTRTGLYRLVGDNWERLEFPVPAYAYTWVVTVAATEDRRLYVHVHRRSNAIRNDPPKMRKVDQELARDWWIFRSTDFGDSWKDITPTDAWPQNTGNPPYIRLVAAGKTLLAMERGMVRSTDGGDTWMPPQPPDTSPSTRISSLPDAALNEHVFYVNAGGGLQRSIDGGKSWNKVNFTQARRRLYLDNLIAYEGNDKGQSMLPVLYAISSESIVKTTDKGKSWKTIGMGRPSMTAPVRKETPRIIQIAEYGGVLYAKTDETRLYRVSKDDNKLVEIQNVPFFTSSRLKRKLEQSSHEKKDASELPDDLFVEQLQESFSGATEFFKQLAQIYLPPEPPFLVNSSTSALIRKGKQGAFAVSDNTFYMEYNFKIFRWEPGDTEWQDTGQQETVELTWDIARKPLKLAVSGDTVYVGKRDGHLFVSFDKGNNWRDLTPALPLAVKTFKEIVVAGTTVYVATDAGTITSNDGRTWRVVTDAEGTNLVMEYLAVDGTTAYGVTNETGIYRLESGTWKQVVSEIPNDVMSLAADRNTLYVGTKNNSMLHFTLEE